MPPMPLVFILLLCRGFTHALGTSPHIVELNVETSSVLGNAPESVQCWSSHTEWGQLLVPQNGSVGAEAGHTVVFVMNYAVMSNWDPLKLNITACPIPDWKFLATFPSKPVKLDPRCELVGQIGNNVLCEFGKVEVDVVGQFNTTLLMSDGQPPHGVLGFTWEYFDPTHLRPPQPSANRYGILATGGLNLGMPVPLAPPYIPPTPPTGFDDYVVFTPKAMATGSIAGSSVVMKLIVGVSPQSKLAAKNLKTALSLYFGAKVVSWTTVSSDPAVVPGNCTLLPGANPPGFDCMLGAVAVGASVTVVVQTVMPAGIGKVLSAPDMRSGPGWGALGWDLDAPSGSYPGKTCGQANGIGHFSPNFCPSAFALNSIVDVTG